MDAVPLKVRKQRTVLEAMKDYHWPIDIQGGLSLIGLYKYFQMWDALHDFAFFDVDDHHEWRFDKSGSFSSKSTYRALFNMARLSLSLGEGYGGHGKVTEDKGTGKMQGISLVGY